ncbi:nitrogenase component 1 [Sporomusa aerivorans]|uniref:nitrogenase component 1 n=1 Tax=Sporomusa aerivorans TaxID=204936 RepID=UPI00352A7FE5
MVMNKRATPVRKRGYSCTMPGVWRAAAHNEGAVVIYHSPKACGHIGREMELGMHFRSLAQQQFCAGQYSAPLVISGLQEEHSIFGGAGLLRECIDYVAAEYKPKYILIANSCVAGVIGDDTAAVAGEAEQAWGIPVMSVPCYGYLDGDYYTGFYHAGKVLAERFMVKQPKLVNMVTLLGDRGGPNGADVQEIKRLLGYFGLKVYCHFPAFASLEDIRRVPFTVMTVPLSGTRQSYPWIRKLGLDLEATLDVPLFDSDYPAGWQATVGWLTDLGRFLKQEEEAAMVIEMELQRLKLHVDKCSTVLKRNRIAVCIGRPVHYFDPALFLELCALYEVQAAGIVILDDMLAAEQAQALRQELSGYATIPCFAQAEAEAKALLQTADIIVTTHELADTGKKQLFLPLLPLAGVGGIMTLMTKLVQLAERHERRGGVMYV